MHLFSKINFLLFEIIIFEIKNLEFREKDRSFGLYDRASTCACTDKKEHRKTGNWLSCQVAKLVHSTNETNIQRARFDKKEEWREREREREQLENNSEQILDNLWITAFFYIVNLLHFIVSLLKINMDEKKEKKYLKDLRCFLFPFFISWEIFCDSVQFTILKTYSWFISSVWSFYF